MNTWFLKQWFLCQYHVIFTHFEFHEERHTNRLHFSSNICTEFYLFNETNIYRNLFSLKLSSFEVFYMVYLSLRIRVNLTQS